MQTYREPKYYCLHSVLFINYSNLSIRTENLILNFSYTIDSVAIIEINAENTLKLWRNQALKHKRLIKKVLASLAIFLLTHKFINIYQIFEN